MSRSGYHEEGTDWDLIRWRGAVASAIRGARGQRMLRELLAALDAMPNKSLAANSLVTADGQYCALGALGAKRSMDLAKLDPDDTETVAAAFGIAPALAREIVFENDERTSWCAETPEARWQRMREWVVSNIKTAKEAE